MSSFDPSRLVGTASLPADYLQLTSRRLGVAAAIAALVFGLYGALYRTVWVAQSHRVGQAAGVLGLVVSSLVAAYVLLGTREARAVARVAVFYEVFLALDLGISESWASRYDAPSFQVPWAALIIVLFPFLIPAPPRWILLSSLASALMTPLALALAFAASGRPWPAAPIVASHVLPPLVAALLAWAPTSALDRMRADMQRARRLGSYELMERLGAGGMGEVWRANHQLLARPAAIKLVRPELLGARDARSREMLIQRFEKEAQVTASLESPHSVELYDFGVSSDGVLFYVMELLQGMDLETLVQRFGPLPPERALYLLAQACDSLEDAHERGLIHRDIKPANLFVARKGATHDFLKVLDFGLVKRWDAPPDAAASSLGEGSPLRTAVGQIVGTPAFLAPEAALGEGSIDRRVDIYALGCVAYWMLCGAAVFDAGTVVGMVAAHVSRPPPPLAPRCPAPIGDELEALVMRCLEKERDERPSSARELRDALAAVSGRERWSRERAAAWWQAHLPLAARVRDSSLKS